MEENLFQQSIENIIENEDLKIEDMSNKTKSSVDYILSVLGTINNGIKFKKYKVVINGEKGKVISNTPQKGIFVKFDNSSEVKNYSSIDEIETFKILRVEKNNNKKQ